MKFCATFLSLCDDEEEKEMEEEEEGGRATHGGKRMRWSDKQPPTFDHRLVSWIHFNAPRRTAFLVLFYELSIAGDVAVKMEEINFFRFAVIRGKNRDPARFGIEFVFIRSEYAVLLGIGIIKGSNARIFFGNFSISFHILSFR